MTWETIAAAATVIGTILTVLLAVRKIRSDARDLSDAQSREKQDTYNRGVIDGQRSRDDEVRQLKFERDDARHDRDRYETDMREWRTRYNDLRDKGLH